MKDNGPLACYRALLKSGVINPDPAQELAVEKLHLLHLRLAEYEFEQGRSEVFRGHARLQRVFVDAPMMDFVQGDPLLRRRSFLVVR